MFEARLALRRISDAAALAASFKDFDKDPEKVYWLEKGRTSQGETFVTLIASPLDITGMMEEAVFTKFRSVICTSATLSVGDSFDFWRGRVGLRKGDEKARTAVYPSPFPYRTNALLGLDREAPAPDSPDWRNYVNRAIVELLGASEGRALVLFTSYEALKAAYEIAKPAMEALGIICLRQGEAERGRLLETFRNDIASVLFATDSFWEGVDAPGETLSLVIITKLPFRVPTDPVQLARSEAVEKKGGNAFMEISLPEAVIRLKQGFGRLIRHSDDRGAVVILDSRVVTKRYGGLFVTSLPECRIVTAGIGEIAPEVHRFLFDW
jgi:ATP-dependent DNA helicase DinG